MSLKRYPTVVAHADWSKDAKKRWVSVAERAHDGHYVVRSLEPVGDLPTYFQRLRQRGPEPATVFAGFDFPIGLPSSYAASLGIDDFVAHLPAFGVGAWADFYTLAQAPQEVSPRRPFYPRSCRKKGDASQETLYSALGAGEMTELLRVCEHATSKRQAASPLFWTLGGKQVGRAAITGWRDLLAPAMAEESSRIRFWPFHGSLAQTLNEGELVIAETYPAEYYHHLGLDLGPVAGAQGYGKRVQACRSANAGRLLGWLAEQGIRIEDHVVEAVNGGFGSRSDGEDRFDAFVGLLGMLEVLVRGAEPAVGVPPNQAKVEGWILGQAASG